MTEATTHYEVTRLNLGGISGETSHISRIARSGKRIAIILISISERKSELKIDPARLQRQ